MSLQSKYKTINKYTFTEGYFSTPAGYTLAGTFEGLIQSPKPNSTFNNGKSTINIDAVLFCDKKEVFTDTDIIKYADGNAKYKIGNSDTQTDGVCGLEPKKGQHSEYVLTYTQESIEVDNG
jgi:hypothetical protein